MLAPPLRGGNMGMRHIKVTRFLAFTLLLPLLASAVGPPGGIPPVEAAPATDTGPGSTRTTTAARSAMSAGNPTVLQASTPTPTPTPQRATMVGEVGGIATGGAVLVQPTPSPTPCPTSGIAALHACIGNVAATGNFEP